MLGVILDKGVFTVESEGRVIEVGIHSFKKKVFASDSPGFFCGAFGAINLFLRANPEIEFSVARRLYRCCELVLNPKSDLKELTGECSELANLIFTYEADIREYISGDCFLPPDNSSEKWAVSDKTYNPADYLDIVVLSTMLSVFIPIWGSYMHQIKGAVTSKFKESYALALLKDSCIWGLESTKKVMLYVSAIDAGSDKSSHIIDMMCSEEAVDSIAHRAIVRKVAPHDPGIKAQSNLISSVHRLADTGQNGRTHYLKDKPQKKASCDEESGFADIYMVSSQYSTGQLEEIRYACKFKARVASAIFGGRSVPKKALAVNHKFYDDWKPSDVSKIAVIVLEWLFCNRVIAINGVPYLQFDEIKTLLAVAKTYLEAVSMDYMALLVSSKVLRDEQVVYIGALRARERLSAELKERMAEIWPYFKPSNGQKKCALTNVAAQDIEAAIKTMATQYVSPADSGLATKCQDSVANGVLSVPGNIRALMARLLIKINEDSV